MQRFCSNNLSLSISEGDEIVRACDRHRDETVTLTKHVTKYKYMRIWMVQFLNSHDQIYQFTLISYVPFLAMTSSSTRFLTRPPVIIPPWA